MPSIGHLDSLTDLVPVSPRQLLYLGSEKRTFADRPHPPQVHVPIDVRYSRCSGQVAFHPGKQIHLGIEIVFAALEAMRSLTCTHCKPLYPASAGPTSVKHVQIFIFALPIHLLPLHHKSFPPIFCNAIHTTIIGDPLVKKRLSQKLPKDLFPFLNEKVERQPRATECCV